MYLLFGGSTFQVEGWRFQKGSANLISKERFVGVKDWTLTCDARDAVPDHRGTILSWALGPHIHAILSVVFEVGNGVVTPFLWTAAVRRHSVVLIVYLDDNGGAQASGFFPGQPDLGVGPVWSDTHQIRHTAHAWNNRSKRQKGVYFMEMRLFHSFTPPPPPQSIVPHKSEENMEVWILLVHVWVVFGAASVPSAVCVITLRMYRVPGTRSGMVIVSNWLMVYCSDVPVLQETL